MLHKNIFLVQTVPFFQHGLDLKLNSKFNVLGGWTKPNNISTNDIHKYKEGDNARLILEPFLSAHSLTLQVILNSPQNKLYLPANQKF
jgi:hypothetical protein